MRFLSVICAIWGMLLPQIGFGSDDLLFDYLAKYTAFPYTLLGHKPMALGVLPDANPRRKSAACMLTKWWEDFYTHRRKVDYPNYCIRQADKRGIFLIDKKKCLQVIKDNLDIFQDVCGEKKAETLLSELCEADNLFRYIHDNQRLLGMLLGYGRENARIWEEFFIKFCPPPDDFGYFNSETYDGLLFYRMPNFRSLDNTQETETLRHIYLQDQKHIAEVFSQGKARDIFFEYLEKNN